MAVDPPNKKRTGPRPSRVGDLSVPRSLSAAQAPVLGRPGLTGVGVTVGVGAGGVLTLGVGVTDGGAGGVGVGVTDGVGVGVGAAHTG